MKYLVELAEKIAKDDIYISAEYAYSVLLEVRKALLKGRYYTGVESVSKSGMSRVIAIRWIKDNELYYAPDFIYKLAGCDRNNRIGGCGMDMLFAAQYNLFQSLCPRHRYQDSMQRYRSL